MGKIYLLLALAGCGYGHDVVRSDERTLLENLGDNRYVYRTTPLLQLAAKGPAAPALGIAPAGAREVGLIEVGAEYSGSGGAGGLRDSEAEFYPRLAEVAGSMGGTHFMVLRSAHVSRFGVDWISTLTVDVFEQQ
jgi:hypothetical protein